jgi:hypothetical protein
MRHEISPLPVRPWTLNGTSERLIVLTLLVAGCGSSTSAEYPALNGRRVQTTSIVAQSTVPYQVGAYELTFTAVPGDAAQPRRAALLVDMAAGKGLARGFVEWGRRGEVPMTYVAGGWARQRDVQGELVTVFELTLNHLEARNARRSVSDAEHPVPFAVRVVVNETSGDVTLARRR